MSPRPKWIWQNIWTTSIFALIQSLTRQPPMSWFINIRPGLWSKTFLRGAWLPASPTARQARVSDFWGHWGRWEFGTDFFTSNIHFYHHYSSLLFGILWPNVRKKILLIEKDFWNLWLKAENLQNVWDHENNLFKQWKVRTIFGSRMLY